MKTAYRSNLNLTAVARKIRQSRQVAITTHAKPDGDAFGSVVALAAALRQLHIEVSAWFIPPVPATFRCLKGRDLVQSYNPSVGLPQVDLMVVVDTGAWSQLAPMRDRLSPALLERTLIIDHHLAGDLPAAWRHVDPKSAACCEIIFRLIGRLQGSGDSRVDLLTPVVCEALFVGVASDTGWFRFSNTRAQTHGLAAKLIRRGVNQAQIYQELEQQARPEKLALQTRALGSLRLHADGRVAVMVLRAEDFIETGALLEETERFVDMPQSVVSVQVVVLITQTPPHHKHTHRPVSPSTANSTPPETRTVRLSFRSKPGPQAVDVAQLASRFGGGGHARAAGAKVKAPLGQVVQQVEQATVLAVGEQNESEIS